MIQVGAMARVQLVIPDEDRDRFVHQARKEGMTLSPRDLCHLASCRRRGVSEIKTFDQALRAVSAA